MFRDGTKSEFTGLVPTFGIYMIWKDADLGEGITLRMIAVDQYRKPYVWKRGFGFTLPGARIHDRHYYKTGVEETDSVN